MTEPLRPGLHPLSHLKASPTTSSSRSIGLPSSTVQQAASTPRHRSGNNVSREGLADPTNERVTTTLIRRVLCPQAGTYGAPQPLEELLPPLTSSNDVDRQLYAIIAIVVKEFVYSWYSRITTDQALVNESLQVVAHCTRALEQRSRRVDVAQLVLDEIPSLVETHILSYRLAREQPNLSGLPPSTRAVYHALNPHPALSPVPEPSDPQTIIQQAENEAMYRQLLMHGMLAVLLPTEDLENACLRTLIGDIMADLLMGNEVSGTICEGWFIWETVSKFLDSVSDIKDCDSEEAAKGSERGRSKDIASAMEESKVHGSKSHTQLSVWFWTLLHGAYLTYVALRFIATGLFRAASSPSSQSNSAGSTSHGNEAPKSAGSASKRGVLDYRLCSMVSQLLDVPRRMPWLTGMLSLMQYMAVAGPGRIGDIGSVLDRFLHETIQDHLLTPTLLPNLLRAARAGLFPGNARPPPTPALEPGRVQSQGTGVLLSSSAPQLSVQQQTPPGPPRTSTTESIPPTEGDAPSTSTATAKSNTNAPSPSAPSPTPSSSEIDPAAIKRQCAVRILRMLPRHVVRMLLDGQHDRDNDRDLNHNHVSVPASSCPNDIDPITHSDNPSGTNDNDNNETNETNETNPNDTATPTTNPHNEKDLAYLESIESTLLDLFADDYANKHLVYSIIELVLVRLLPELGEKSVAELLEDRGVVG